MPVLGGIEGADGSIGASGVGGTSQKWRESIANCKCTSELRSTRPNLVPLWATRCLYQGHTSELRSTRPNLVLLLATRCLYQGVHLRSGQLDPSQYHSWPLDASTRGVSELRSTRPNLVPLSATRCLYWGYIWPKVRVTKCQADLMWYHSWPLDASTRGYILPQVNWTQLSTTLGHEMPLLGGVCLTWVQKGHLKILNNLHFMLCFTEFFSTKDQL